MHHFKYQIEIDCSAAQVPDFQRNFESFRIVHLEIFVQLADLHRRQVWKTKFHRFIFEYF